MGVPPPPGFLDPLEEYRLQEPFVRRPLEDSQEFLCVTDERVLNVLSRLNRHKAAGPDEIPKLDPKGIL